MSCIAGRFFTHRATLREARIVHFISNLMLMLIWQEILVGGLEVGDSCFIRRSSPIISRPGSSVRGPCQYADTLLTKPLWDFAATSFSLPPRHLLQHHRSNSHPQTRPHRCLPVAFPAPRSVWGYPSLPPPLGPSLSEFSVRLTWLLCWDGFPQVGAQTPTPSSVPTSRAPSPLARAVWAIEPREPCFWKWGSPPASTFLGSASVSVLLELLNDHRLSWTHDLCLVSGKISICITSFRFITVVSLLWQREPSF